MTSTVDSRRGKAGTTARDPPVKPVGRRCQTKRIPQSFHVVLQGSRQHLLCRTVPQAPQWGILRLSFVLRNSKGLRAAQYGMDTTFWKNTVLDGFESSMFEK